MCDIETFKRVPDHIKIIFMDNPEGNEKRKLIQRYFDQRFPSPVITVIEYQRADKSKFFSMSYASENNQYTNIKSIINIIVESVLSSIKFSTKRLFVLRFAVYKYGNTTGHAISVIYDIFRSTWELFDSSVIDEYFSFYEAICQFLNNINFKIYRALKKQKITYSVKKCRILHNPGTCVNIQGMYPTCLLWSNAWIYLRTVFYKTSPFNLTRILGHLNHIENMCLFLKIIQDVLNNNQIIEYPYTLDKLTDENFVIFDDPNYEEPDRATLINEIRTDIINTPIRVEDIQSINFTEPVFPSLVDIIIHKIRKTQRQSISMSSGRMSSLGTTDISSPEDYNIPYQDLTRPEKSFNEELASEEHKSFVRRTTRSIKKTGINFIPDTQSSSKRQRKI